MRDKLIPRSLYPPCGDPGLMVHAIVEGYEFLFDLPPLHRVSTHLLRRVKAVFVTHTHVDHFVGMGRFIRANLTREEGVTIYGPEGFIRNVEGFLSAFTWNLGDEYPFHLTAVEVTERTIRSAQFTCEHHFVREGEEERPPEEIIYRDGVVIVRTIPLDHGIPVLGYRMDGHRHININAQALEEKGFTPGPWINALKTAVRSSLAPETPITTSTGTKPLGDLMKELVIITPGQKMGYVVDVACTRENLDRLTIFLEGVDTLYIETTFSEEDMDRAEERNHLSTRHAAKLAEAVGARRLRPLHISPRYRGMEEELGREIERYFTGDVQFISPPPLSGSRERMARWEESQAGES